MSDPSFNPVVPTPCLTPMFNLLFVPLVQPLVPPLPSPGSPLRCVCTQLVDGWSGQSYRVLAVAMADLPHLACLDLPRMTQQQVEDQAGPFHLLGLIILSNHINPQSKATVKQLQEGWVDLPTWAHVGCHHSAKPGVWMLMCPDCTCAPLLACHQVRLGSGWGQAGVSSG